MRKKSSTALIHAFLLCLASASVIAKERLSPDTVDQEVRGSQSGVPFETDCLPASNRDSASENRVVRQASRRRSPQMMNVAECDAGCGGDFDCWYSCMWNSAVSGSSGGGGVQAYECRDTCASPCQGSVCSTSTICGSNQNGNLTRCVACSNIQHNRNVSACKGALRCVDSARLDWQASLDSCQSN